MALDITKVKSIDGIGPLLLNNCTLALYQPLCHLHVFVQSVKQHRIPAEWKIHAITPIHKSGDRQMVSNYRPISLLSCTSKVLERIINVRLYSAIQDSCSQVQFGFRNGYLTLQQLLLFYHQIFCKSLSCHEQWDIVYLDFSKAFDTVSHSELLSKLYNLGVHGDLWLWLRCYLQDR